MATNTVKVPNMSCTHCTGTIEREVSELAGVTSVKADINSKMVTITWHEPPLTWPQIASLLEEIGYPAQ